MGSELVLTRDMAIVLGLVVFTMTMFMFERIRSDVTALVVLIALGVTGIIEQKDLWLGFSGSAVISIVLRQRETVTLDILDKDRRSVRTIVRNRREPALAGGRRSCTAKCTSPSRLQGWQVWTPRNWRRSGRVAGSSRRSTKAAVAPRRR